MEEKHIIRMIDNLSAVEHKGLSYGVMEGYIKEGTSDEELDNAIKLARENLEIVGSKLSEFEDEIEKGKYSEYL